VKSCPSGHDLGIEEIGVRGEEEEMYCKYIHVANGVWVTVKVARQSNQNKSHKKCEV